MKNLKVFDLRCYSMHANKIKLKFFQNLIICKCLKTHAMKKLIDQN